MTNENDNIKTDWPPIEKPPPSETEKKLLIWEAKFETLNKRIFWPLAAAAILILAVGAFYFYQYYFVSSDVSIKLKAPNDIFLGVPFDLEIVFLNGAEKALMNVEISLIAPEGTIFNEEKEKKIIVKSLGDLGPGESAKIIAPATIFWSDQSIKKFDATASYSMFSTGPARFEQSNSVEVAAKEPAIKLDLAAPQKVLRGDDFEFSVNYENISETDFENVELKISYPNSFIFKEADIKPAAGNNLWKIGKLAPKNKGGVSIKGNIVAGEGSFFEIKAEIKSNDMIISKKTSETNVSFFPVGLNINIDRPNNLARAEDGLRYYLEYANNSEVGLNDVIIKAKLKGEMYDFSSLKTKSFFNSLDNTIIWNAANTPELRLLAPGAKGKIEFEISTKKNYPIKKASDKNFTLKIDAEISSPTVPYYVAADKTIYSTTFETKVAGKIDVEAQAFYRFPKYGFVSEGQLPPKVNAPTYYFIRLTIANYASDVKEIELKTFLQSGVRWTGKIRSNIDSAPAPVSPSPNERTSEIRWIIPNIWANEGVINKPIEAVFQIEAVPDVTQINKPMPLLSETVVTAFDKFAEIRISDSNRGLTTVLEDDSTVTQQQGIVKQ